MLGIIIFRYDFVWSLLCFLYFTVIANNLFLKKLTLPSPLFVSNNKVGEQHVDAFYTLKKLPPCNLNCVFSCCCFAGSLAIAFFCWILFCHRDFSVWNIWLICLLLPLPHPSLFFSSSSFSCLFSSYFPFLKMLRLAFFHSTFLWALIVSILSLNIYNLECS